ncbi:unnamed protein product [Effrenium voratum]|uniref:Uncharacterized protein n=1 Tax=Effrenium voratum TaxID=2562239 RepID=A0AA36IAE3_9DINO|nr:unnamed protein product [Effrenium voratum]
MPPIDSETPEVILSEAEVQQWLQGIAWEKDLDEQREHRLLREGLFWHDERLDGLSDDDRMWEIIKMSFLQVAKVLDSVGCVQYFEYFLGRGIMGAKHLRLLTVKYVETKMPRIKDPTEREAIVAAAARCMQDEEMRFFEARYGDVDRLVLDCQHARRFLSEKLIHEKWMIDQYDLTAPLHLETSRFHTKWAVPAADKESFHEFDDWVAATSCDGFLFLWPIIEGDRVPPVVRCRQLHSAPCVDFSIDWDRMEALTCGLDGKVSLYDLQKDSVKTEVRDNQPNQLLLCVDCDLELGKAAVGTNFGCIKLLDLQTKQFLMSLLGHKDHCRKIAVEWDENIVVSCSWDSNVHIYDLRSPKLVHCLAGHNANCCALHVDFNKHVAMSSANEYRFLMWDLRQRKLLETYESPGHNVNCLHMDLETGKMASGSDDGLVKIWDLETGEWERSLDCMHDMTLALDADWERGRLVTASWDYNVDLWDLKTGEHLNHFFKPRRCMTQVRMKKLKS